jgi:hypothetical protein
LAGRSKIHLELCKLGFQFLDGLFEFRVHGSFSSQSIEKIKNSPKKTSRKPEGAKTRKKKIGFRDRGPSCFRDGATLPCAAILTTLSAWVAISVSAHHVNIQKRRFLKDPMACPVVSNG